jgi:hypothetical protein
VVGFVVIPEQLDVMIDYAMHEIRDAGLNGTCA